jgi:hypothetical protein
MTYNPSLKKKNPEREKNNIHRHCMVGFKNLILLANYKHWKLELNLWDFFF